MSKKGFMDCGGNLLLGLAEVFAGVAYINRVPGPKSKLDEKLELWHYEDVANNPWKTHPQYRDRNKEYIYDYIEYLKNRRLAQPYYESIIKTIYKYFGSCTIKTIQPVVVPACVIGTEDTYTGDVVMLGDWDFASEYNSMLRLKYLRPYRNDKEMWLSMLGSHIIESAFMYELRPKKYRVIETCNNKNRFLWVDKHQIMIFNKKTGSYDISMTEYENQIYNIIIDIYKEAMINGITLEKRFLVYPAESSSVEEYRKYEEYDFDYSTYHAYALQTANDLRLMPSQIKDDTGKKIAAEKTTTYCY